MVGGISRVADASDGVPMVDGSPLHEEEDLSSNQLRVDGQDHRRVHLDLVSLCKDKNNLMLSSCRTLRRSATGKTLTEIQHML